MSDWTFEPMSKTDQNNFFIKYKGDVVATLWWKRNHPAPQDKVAVVTDNHGNIFIGPNEKSAVEWLIKNMAQPQITSPILGPGITLL